MTPRCDHHEDACEFRLGVDAQNTDQFRMDGCDGARKNRQVHDAGWQTALKNKSTEIPITSEEQSIGCMSLVQEVGIGGRRHAAFACRGHFVP